MELLLIIGIVIVLIINDRKNNKEDNRIICYDIKTGRPIFSKDVNITGIDPKTGLPLYEYKKKIIGYNTQTGYPIFEGDTPEINKNKISNTILMIAGAFLILLASIIFLKSTWYDMPNILKTIVLIAIQLIFLLFSKICDKKLDIPKISRLFKYISYGFISVILLSGSYFEIFGEYFSKHGEGYYLYAGISFIITDIAYKLIAKGDKNLKTASYLAEIIGIIFIGCMINEQFVYSLLLLTIHTIIMFILLHGNYLDKEAYELTYNIVSVLLIILSILINLFNSDISSYINLFILSAFCFTNHKFFCEEKDKMLYLILFFITYIPLFRLIGTELELMNFIYYILSMPIIFLLKGTEKSYKNTLRIIYALFSLLFMLELFFNTEESLLPLINYIVAISFYIFSYKYLNEPIYKTAGYLSLTLLIFEISKLIMLDDIMKYIPMLSALLIMLIETILKKLKDKTSHTFIFILLILQTIICILEMTFIIPVVLIAIYIYANKLNEDLMIIPMFLSLNILTLSESIIIPIISFLLIGLCTMLSLKKKTFNIYTLFSLIQIIATYEHCELDIAILFIVFIIWGILHLFFSKDKTYIYKLVTTASGLGLYYRFLVLVNVPFTSIYILGLYISSIIVSRAIFNFEERKIDILELVSFILLTLLGIITSTDLANGIILIAILVALAILSFAKKMKYYAYGSIIGLIGCIILQTISYWALIPWYVYILLIGLILISYAIYDENKKQKKKVEEEKSKEKDI